MAEDTLYYKDLSAGSNWITNASGGAVPFSGGVSGYINLPKAYAAVNRKNMRHTDNKGYALAYVVEVEAIGSTSQAQEIEIYSAPENWVLKNAVRKWHIARNAMLERAGMLGKVGEYGRTIRPYLSVTHAGAQGDAIPRQFELANTEVGTTSESSTAITQTSLVGGEWTYTSIAAPGDTEEAQIPRPDRYKLVLTGDHNANSGAETSQTRLFTHVSMMRSYLESRRNPSQPAGTTQGGGVLNQEPSPLTNLMHDGITIGEVKEIVQDHQLEKTPYEDFVSGDVNALNGNDALDLVSRCHLVTSTSYYKDKTVIRVPMGLMHVRATANGSETPKLRFRLLGIDKCQG
jgi:hypothetical protein